MIIENLLKQYSPYDFNLNGICEINDLQLYDSTWQQQIDDSDNILLIVINPILLTKYPNNPWVKRLKKSLEVFRNDLINDGYRPIFITADVYSGLKHQDGLTVLAIRRFFQEIKKNFPNFKGAILIGSFPEAHLVRTYPRKMHAGFDRDGNAVTINGHTIEDKDYLRIWPEIIATRSDLVLCDLDGNWEKIYHETAELRKLTAVPKKEGGPKDWWEHGSLSILDEQEYTHYDPKLELYEESKVIFNDFFHINDGNYRKDIVNVDVSFPKKWKKKKICLVIFNKRNLELNSEDLNNPNPIAIPEIIISRIDAKHVAVVPNKKMLDKNYIPQEVSIGGTANFTFYDNDAQYTLFEQDPIFECQLIVEYLERNHYHRTRSRDGDIDWDFIAGPGFKSETTMREVKLLSICFEIPGGASLSQYITWLRLPKLIRFIVTHANQRYLSFRDISDRTVLKNILNTKDDIPEKYRTPLLELVKKTRPQLFSVVEDEIAELNSYLGNKPERWFWDEKNKKLCPGWKNHEGRANMYVHKALWNSGMKHDWGKFYIIDGCNVLTPEKYNFSYNATAYGREQVAESLLFYCGGLAIFARAKTFNDLPSIVGMIILNRRRFGEIWSEYFNSVKQDGSLYCSSKGIRRKKPYFWGLIGDWTLKFAYNK
jgi:hypothetical protein